MVKPYSTFYFFPLTEFEFFIMAGVSQALKKFGRGKSVLILTEHPRIKGKMDSYLSQFEEVVKLPFCKYSFNLAKGYKTVLSYCKSVKNCNFRKNSFLFMCSSRHLAQMILLKYFKKNSGNNTFVLILPYAENKNNMKVDIFTSVMMNFYSVVFCRKFILCVREKEHPGFLGYRTKKDWDVLVYIEQEGEIGDFLTAQNMPFPLNFIGRNEIQFPSRMMLKDNAVIFFLDSTLPEMHGIDEVKYRQVINKIISVIRKKNPSTNIYIKMHPGGSSGMKFMGNICVNYRELDKAIAAEEYYIANPNRIAAVFSTASTALLSASWMGIRAYNFSDMAGYQDTLKARFEKYLRPGKNIVHLREMADVEKITIPIGENSIGQNKDSLGKWGDMLESLLGPNNL